MKSRVEEEEVQETEHYFNDDEDSTLLESQSEGRHKKKFAILTIFLLFLISLISAIVVVIIHNSKDTDSYVLIATGYGYPTPNGTSEQMKTEILDLNNHHFQCNEDLPDYPIKMNSGAGGLVNGIPMICGGAPEWQFYNAYQDCFKLQPEAKSNEWKKVGRGLDRPVYAMGSGNVVLKSRLLINGGNRDLHFLKSSHLIGLDSTLLNLPDMPKAIMNHCIVQINETHLIVTGGNLAPSCDIETNKTFLYNTRTGVWSNGPDLIQARTYHGCSKIIFNGKPIVLVTGGASNGHADNIKTVEFLDLSAPNAQWVKGKDLPLALAFHKMVNAGNTTWITGGNFAKDLAPVASSQVFELKCPDQDYLSCYFNKSKVEMKKSRCDHVALSIPSKLVRKLCK